MNLTSLDYKIFVCYLEFVRRLTLLNKQARRIFADYPKALIFWGLFYFWNNSPALRRGGWGASCLTTPYIKTYKNQRGDPARKGWGAQRLGNNCISHTHLRKKLDFMRVSGHFFFRNFICFWYHITGQELKVATVRKEKTGCISTPGFLDFFNHFR